MINRPRKINYPAAAKRSIPTLLEHYMNKEGVSQVIMATMIEMTPAQLNNILQGRQNPSRRLLKVLHSKFKIDGNLLISLL